MPGKTTAHVLGCGTMHCDLTWLLLQPGRSITDRSNPAKPAEWVICPTHAVLVDHPEGRILWDTSCPRDWEERWAPTGLQEYFPYDNVTEEEYFDARLRQLGLEAGDIDVVVTSHLHFDHAGNVRQFASSEARLICHEKEYEFANGFEGAFQGAHVKADYEGIKGHGFDIAAPGGGFGLTSMRERARSVGGELLVFSAPGHGSEVEVAV
jgi:N-acyl homoserine lactone hydrolase